MIHLIVNADDFGLSPGVCRGIVQAMEHGIVTASTAMVCVSDAERTIMEHAPALRGRLGLHLQLTKGRPCLPAHEIPSLVTAEGLFPDTLAQLTAPDGKEIHKEFQAQARRMRDMGLTPSHLDAHHHAFRLPPAFPAYRRLARELGIPARGLDASFRETLRHDGIPTADLFIDKWYKEDLTPGHLMEILDNALSGLPDGARAELMTHPGLVDSELRSRSSYTTHRERELECLCSKGLRQELEARGVMLATPEALAPRQTAGKPSRA